MHPWFRIVNPVRNTLKEPVQEPEDARPLETEELDAEIIRHMRWLFAPGPSHADPEGKTVFDEEALLVEIQEKVTNKEENMEKLFYRLLCQHKMELLENYSGDECDTQPGNHGVSECNRWQCWKIAITQLKGKQPILDYSNRCSSATS